MTMMKTGTIFLPTASARALWKSEIVGQMSDGMWENSRPHDHWKFWCRCEVAEGEPNVVAESGHIPSKNAYNLAGLVPIIGDRMVAAGKMGLAGGDENACRGAKYMPPTLAEFEAKRAADAWEHDFIRRYLVGVTSEVAATFYATKYLERHMRADLKSMKQAMKTCRVRWW